MSFPRSKVRSVLIALLLTLACGLVALQVTDLRAASDAPVLVPTSASLGGGCFKKGIFLCDLCRPCPENCIQACGEPLCQCECVGCIDEGGL